VVHNLEVEVEGVDFSKLGPRTPYNRVRRAQLGELYRGQKFGSVVIDSILKLRFRSLGASENLLAFLLTSHNEVVKRGYTPVCLKESLGSAMD